MINLHQRYNHYLHTNLLLDHEEINERVISYGWTDDGKNLTGYYIVTENWVMHYDLSENYIGKERLVSERQ
jgi:hypothetical protein